MTEGGGSLDYDVLQLFEDRETGERGSGQWGIEIRWTSDPSVFKAYFPILC